MSFAEAYRCLFDHYGEQHWWPADTTFEVMVGAILTQNTAWTNVEKAIQNLQQHALLDLYAITNAPIEVLAEQLRPSGYFNIKAKRLKNFCHWLVSQGGERELAAMETDRLRSALLSVNGVGPETADDILLYAFNRPVFVIDAYTRRIFSRLGLVDEKASYETLRHQFEENLKRDSQLFNEYHALIVVHAKEHCRKKPQCRGCCLSRLCGYTAKEN